MSTEQAPAAPGADPPQQGRSWKQTIFQILLMQLVFRLFSSYNKKPAEQEIAGVKVPLVRNNFTPGSPYDFYLLATANPATDLLALADDATFAKVIWAVPDLVYDAGSLKDGERSFANVTYLLPPDLAQSLLSQVIPADLGDENEPAGGEDKTVTMATKQLFDKFTGNLYSKRRRELIRTFKSVHLVAYIVPHSAYCFGDPNTANFCAPSLSETLEPELLETLTLQSHVVDNTDKYITNLDSHVRAHLLTLLTSIRAKGLEADFKLYFAEESVQKSISLVEYMKPLKSDTGVQYLWGKNDNKTAGSNNAIGMLDEGPDEDTTAAEVPYWKSKIDIRVVYDQAAYSQQTIKATPHLRRFLEIIPGRSHYKPVLFPTDLWLTEEDYIEVNATSLKSRDLRMPLSVSFSSLSPTWFMIQSQLNEMWNPDERAISAELTNTPPSPLALMQGTQGRRDAFMLKRIILRTNRYLLAFSAAFMLLHSLFSFLAFKNDIQFWKNNSSMEGLSAGAVVFNFFCELIIGLYLYDSESTSMLILFEIFLGIALSAWKVTKALNVAIQWNSNSWIPRLNITDKQGYVDSDTKKYDQVAIRFMSLALLPCSIGYSIYSLRTKKFKSWYSFVISSLAGTVYTFGFVMMTPQLYINYKKKSVDHLPWRAFTYKALNTFVDDIAAFIIDMPLMHRLACFRDDIIFVCYLYQLWIYRKSAKVDDAAGAVTDAATVEDAVVTDSTVVERSSLAESNTIQESGLRKRKEDDSNPSVDVVPSSAGQDKKND